ncbi:hypothetical protein BFP70_08725 [Thioclava sp. SK-1]|nr:hypothetical protein BFP70_08725 [Thioclava sp. SK-1]
MVTLGSERTCGGAAAPSRGPRLPIDAIGPLRTFGVWWALRRGFAKAAVRAPAQHFKRTDVCSADKAAADTFGMNGRYPRMASINTNVPEPTFITTTGAAPQHPPQC